MRPASACGRALREPDWLLVLTSCAGLVVVAGLLFYGPAPAPAGLAGERTVATLSYERGAPLRRRPGTLVWEAIRAGEELRERDVIYVPPGGSATVSLHGGSLLEIEEQSLVVLEPPVPVTTGNRIALLRGALSGRSGALPLAVRSAGGTAVLEPGTEGRLAAGARRGVRLDVFSGRASVDGRPVASRPAAVRLDEPRRDQRFWFPGHLGEIALRWDPSAARNDRLEVARDRAFGDIVATAPGASGSYAFRPPRPGDYFWRLVDGEGAVSSEERPLHVLVDLPPTPFSPMPGEIVLAPPGRAVPFWWTAVEGALRYRLEISADPAFREVILAAEAQGPGVWADLKLAEGVYWWRVRVADPERGEPLPSAPSAFRLIQTPVPDAPVLFDPTIEVNGDAPR